MKKYKEVFCRDYGIPINVFEEPYFEDRVRLFDTIYGSLGKWEKFKKYVTDIEGYEKEYNCSENILMDIKGSIGYRNFIECSDIGNTLRIDHSCPAVFRKEDVGRYFLSVSIPKDRLWFYVLRHFDVSILGGCEKYDSFISRYSSNPCICDSITLSKLVFDNLNYTGINRYAADIMYTIMYQIVPVCPMLEGRDVYLGWSKVMFDVSCVPVNVVLSYIDHLKDLYSDYIIPVDISIFEVQNIEGFPGFIKRYTNPDGKFEVCSTNIDYMPQIMRILNGSAVRDIDRVFIHNGRLAKFL